MHAARAQGYVSLLVDHRPGGRKALLKGSINHRSSDGRAFIEQSPLHPLQTVLQQAIKKEIKNQQNYQIWVIYSGNHKNWCNDPSHLICLYQNIIAQLFMIWINSIYVIKSIRNTIKGDGSMAQMFLARVGYIGVWKRGDHMALILQQGNTFF